MGLQSSRDGVMRSRYVFFFLFTKIPIGFATGSNDAVGSRLGDGLDSGLSLVARLSRLFLFFS